MMRAWRPFQDHAGRSWRAEGQAEAVPAAPKGRAWKAPGATKPTKVLFVNQYYWPSHASTAQHLTDLAESMAERGYECHVLCSRGGYARGQKRRPRREVHNGVHIHRVGATAFGRKSTIGRMTDYLSFYLRAL